MKPELIGLDLDNTVIDYGPAYRVVAQTFGLDPSLVDRATIRSSLRHEDDDEQWQRFQASLYASGLDAALPAEGLLGFLEECTRQRIDVFLVSHKTSTTPLRFGGEDLRGPALRWLVSNGIVPRFVREENVNFCATRAEKIARIDQLGCQVFVDDLQEVLMDPAFPATVLKFWYSGDSTGQVPVTGEPRAMDFPSLTAWLQAC